MRESILTTTTITVTSEALLNAAIGTFDAATTGTFEIDFATTTLRLGDDLGQSFIVNGTTVADPVDLLAINLHSGVGLTINGENDNLDGNGEYRGLLVYAGNVTVEDLTIQNAAANGGNGGGGGGAGLGGGLFVAQAGTLTVENVIFHNDAAFGGIGSSGTGGGGGGLGGNGGSGPNAGGGGVGARATGSNGASAGSPAIVFRAASGGSGGNGNGGTSYAGGARGGGGAGGGAPSAGKGPNEGGGGGVGGISGNTGGAGGFGGGGAAGVAGGFAGGGGGGGYTGAPGGFGGGGGSGYAYGGTGGFGGGNGNSTQNGHPGGGGGLGAGGNIFVQQGGSLILDSGTLNAGLVHGGAAGAVGAGTGAAMGNDLFIQGSNTITLDAPAGGSLALDGQVTDTAANGGTGAGTLLIDGAGTVVLTGTVNIGGGVTLTSGTFKIDSPSSFTDTGGIVVTGTAALDIEEINSNQAFTTQLQYLAPGDSIDLEGVTPASIATSSTSTTSCRTEPRR